MNGDQSRGNLHNIVSQRLNALVLEMEQADWGAEQVIIAISDAIAAEWLPKFQALNDARQATPGNFVSDGNEG